MFLCMHNYYVYMCLCIVVISISNLHLALKFLVNSIAPNISASISHVAVLSGSNVTLRCVLHESGIPRATIQWTFNGFIITNGTLYLITEDSTRLDINSIIVSHAGSYNCNATNIAGSSVATINIDVKGLFYMH